MGDARTSAPFAIGRYVGFDRVASGGMATVHIGRLVGAGGFARTVAIKRMHSHLANDSAFVAMFLDEAKLASRVRHPHVVSTLDVIAHRGEVFLVMEYVAGASLHALFARTGQEGKTISLPVLARIGVDAAAGLHAAHQAVGEAGNPLNLVHRDVTPQNIMLDVEGMAKVLDFGIAKAASNKSQTQDGDLKGKPAYMSPEQILGESIDRRADVYSLCAVLWEGVVGRRLFAEASSDIEVFQKVLSTALPRPSAVGAHVHEPLERVIMRGLAREPSERYATAEELGEALEAAVTLAPRRAVQEWLREIAGEPLRAEAELVRRIEQVQGEELLELASQNVVRGTRSASAPQFDNFRTGHPSDADSPTSGPPIASANWSGSSPIGTGARDDAAKSIRAGLERRDLAASPWRQNRRAAATALLLLLGGVLLAIVLVVRARTPESTGKPTPLARVATASTSTSLPPADTSPPSPGPSAAPAPTIPTITPSAPAPARRDAPAPTPRALPRGAASHRAPVPSAPSPPRGSSTSTTSEDACASPYYFDDRGIKRIKAECR